ncbi:uncharacterized protein LOC118185871 [Stegodyphus dumicola]|uniref:uncharacterized protein LOC118185871 n=1 Tax=Stegodyphus dumicola TaxID=202533 RepID=UPI0015B05B68|nr:uncharacterized protein LOC118185871 [Stegodyphus dumicola]
MKLRELLLMSYTPLCNQCRDEGEAGNHVGFEIRSRIKKAKYFSLMFYCTTEVSHHEQLCQIIRYVNIKDEFIFIEESLIDFIELEEKTGSGLTNEIICKLEKDGLDIQNVRRQGYDNGANMAELYKGVHAIICQINDQATYIPCSAHSLNLVYKNTASTKSMLDTRPDLAFCVAILSHHLENTSEGD